MMCVSVHVDECSVSVSVVCVFRCTLPLRTGIFLNASELAALSFVTVRIISDRVVEASQREARVTMHN